MMRSLRAISPSTVFALQLFHRGFQKPIIPRYRHGTLLELCINLSDQIGRKPDCYRNAWAAAAAPLIRMLDDNQKRDAMVFARNVGLEHLVAAF